MTEINKEKINVWVNGNEHTKKYFREYHQNSPQTLCLDCGKPYKLAEKSRHFKSVKHNKILNNKLLGIKEPEIIIVEKKQPKVKEVKIKQPKVNDEKKLIKLKLKVEIEELKNKLRSL